MQRVKWKLKELCFEITNECLLNCIHCSSSSKVGEGYLDKESIIRTINEFEEMGGKELEISGEILYCIQTYGKSLIIAKERIFLQHCTQAELEEYLPLN